MSALVDGVDPYALPGCRMVWEAWEPPPDVSLSNWAEEYRWLSPEASAQPGKWHSHRYQREILDTIADNQHQRIIFMASSQVSKTEMILNLIGYHIHIDPCPILIIQPNIDVAMAFSKDRVSPMLRDSPALAGIIRGNRGAHTLEATTSNTILHRTFPGGHLTIGGSNSPATFAARPIRLFVGDELDRWEMSAGKEGDQVTLGEKRTTTFQYDRKIFLCSTPGIKGISRIEREYEASDKRRLYVPCPECGTFQVLLWDNFVIPYQENKSGEKTYDPEAAHFMCTSCSQKIEHDAKEGMMEVCDWRAEKPEIDIAGFWLWEAYSPWSTWYDIASAFLVAKDAGTEKLKTFVNTTRGESWEERGVVPKWEIIKNRADNRESWTVPHGVLFLTAGADLQGDRAEISVYGWGVEEEAWHIGHKVIFGDIQSDLFWEQVKEFFSMEFAQPTRNRKHRILNACFDSGHAKNMVYRFTRSMEQVKAIKGSSNFGDAVVTRPVKKDVSYGGRIMPDGIELWTIGVSQAKSIIYDRLMIGQPGPRYMHYAGDLDDDFYQQLTAEQMVRTYIHGYPQMRWHKVSC